MVATQTQSLFYAKNLLGSINVEGKDDVFKENLTRASEILDQINPDADIGDANNERLWDEFRGLKKLLLNERSGKHKV